LEETRSILAFLASEVSPDTYLNLMAQYYPAGEVSATKYPELHRRLTPAEFRQAVTMAREMGLWRFAE